VSSPEAPSRGASSSAEETERVNAHGTVKGLRALLDTAFGYLVWALHFLIVYIATAVSCQLGLGTTQSSTRTTFLIVLALVTVAAAAIVALHGVRRFRQ
jgi:hypothetical protein